MLERPGRRCKRPRGGPRRARLAVALLYVAVALLDVCDSLICDSLICNSIICSGDLGDGAQDLMEDRDAPVARESGRDFLTCATFGRDSVIYSAVTLLHIRLRLC